MRFLLLFPFLLSSTAEAALSASVYTSSSNKVGSTIAEAVSGNLVRRGFAANDPRILATVESVSAEVTSLASASTGSTWVSTIARLSPYALAGVVVYSGVTWYFDHQGKAYLAPPGSSSNAPVYSNGVLNGQPVYSLSNKPDVYAGSVEEAYSYLVATAKEQNADAKFGTPTITQTSQTQWDVAYNYSIPSLGLYNFSFVATATAQAYNGTVTCLAGYVLVNGQCSSAQLATSPFAGAPIVGYDLPVAFSNLSSQAQAAPLSKDLAAEVANRVYREAAQNPDFKGVPFSSSSPVTADDVAPFANAHPADYPQTSDLGVQVPQISPVASPTTNPNAVKSGSTNSTSIDLGPDPGTPSPTLEDTPDIFKPISSLMMPWLSWHVPQHSSVCPTWSASPSISGYVFNIDLSYHCVFIAQHQDLIYRLSMVVWVVLTVFIIFSA